MNNKDNPKPSHQLQIKVEIPNSLDGTYANLALISHSTSEIVMDFALVLPNVPKAKVQERIIMTPRNAKLLQRALGENLSKFELQHGKINLPAGASLADQLFRHPSDPEADGDKKSQGISCGIATHRGWSSAGSFDQEHCPGVRFEPVTHIDPFVRQYYSCYPARRT